MDAKKVFVFSNLAISVDGKIATASRVHFPLGTSEDRKQMKVLRQRADAILMGASTLRAYKKSLYVGGAEKQPLNVILSSGMEGVSPEWDFFNDVRVRRLLFVSRESEGLKAFEKSSEVVVLKDRPSIALQIVGTLRERGITRLLVEGGGSVMWDFIQEDLIDEYHVTLTPRIIGGTEAPTLVDGKGFEPEEIVNLKLTEARVIGDEVYLVYAKTGIRGGNPTETLN